MRDAKAHQRTQTVLWIDLRNAFGSVHHKLIQFALTHYHCDETLKKLVADLYTGLQATVLTNNWSTAVFRYGVGVFQGDPLSVAIFDMIMNLYTDSLESLKPLCAYQLSSVDHDMFLSIFADDTAIITRGTEEAKLVCKRTDKFLQWSGLQVNASKCATFARRKQPSPAVFDPQLHLQDQRIPFLEKGVSYRYLGLPLSSDLSNENVKSELLPLLTNLLQCVDRTAVSRYAKCILYKRAIVPRLSWLLGIASLSLSWIEDMLDGLVTRYLKKWVGLAHSATVAKLFLNSKRGGLDLPVPSVSFKNLQASRLLRFTRSKDSCLMALANAKVDKESMMTTSNFTAGKCLKDLGIFGSHPGDVQISCEKKVSQVKESIKLQHQDHLWNHLTSLAVQGKVARCIDSDTIRWSTAIRDLPDEQFKFIMNAIVDTLPTRVNLHRWKRSQVNHCPLCGQPQSLGHVLNACPVLLDSGIYKWRHDRLLTRIVDFMKRHLPSDYKMIADLPNRTYIFPSEVAVTNLRPDIIVWKDDSREAWLLELSVVFEPSCEDTRLRKENRYNELLSLANQRYRTKMLHLLIGSRGMVFEETKRSLSRLCKPKHTDLSNLLHLLIKEVVEASYRCWLTRNQSGREES